MTSSPRPNKKGAVLVFGESVNDSQSILHLLIGANVSLAGRVRSLRRPVSLTRDAKPNAVRDWVDELRRTVHAFEANDGRIAAVIVHRDADVHDPDGAVAANLAVAHPALSVQVVRPHGDAGADYRLMPRDCSTPHVECTPGRSGPCSARI